MSLQEIKDVDNLKSCIRVLEGFQPRSFYFIQLIKTVLELGIADYKFFSIHEDSNSAASTAVVSVLDNNTENAIYYAVFYEDKDEELILRVLQVRVNWKKRNLFHCVPEFQYPLIKALISNRRIRIEQELRVKVIVLTRLPDAPVLKSEDKVTVKTIGPEVAEVINSHWSFKSESSLRSLQNELERGVGFGAFVDGELVSWILVGTYGTMSYLNTVPDHRRQGYASMVVHRLCRHLHDLGITPFAHVVVKNEESFNLFCKNNFEYLWECTSFLFGPD